MKIPECYDPVYQAERREAEWDKRLESAPVCSCCGRPITDNGEKYFMMVRFGFSVTFCQECMEALEDGFERVGEEADLYA